MSHRVRPKILFVVTEDWYFWSHRIGLARAARDNGFDVQIATRVKEHEERIRREGFALFPLTLARESRNPAHELAAIIELIRLFRREMPDLIHLVALKPAVYGSVAARFVPDSSLVIAIAGMGYLGTSRSLKASLLRPLLRGMFRLLFNAKNTKVIVQNPEDEEWLRSRVVRNESRVSLIRGSGVDLRVYTPSAEPAGVPVVVLPCRMLFNKGVAEFVEAARLLKARGVAARFLLVGGTDAFSPAAIAESQLLEWEASGAVEWQGQSDDMTVVFRNANIVCLPSYREGVPKALIEAAASGRAIVSTDVPGCREIVRHGINGLLVPAREPVALAEALNLLLGNPEMRFDMGRRGREIAENEFSDQFVFQRTLSLYRELMGQSSPAETVFT